MKPLLWTTERERKKERKKKHKIKNNKTPWRWGPDRRSSAQERPSTVRQRQHTTLQFLNTCTQCAQDRSCREKNLNPEKKEQSTLKIKQHSRKKREAAAASSSFLVAASSQKQLKGSIVDVHRRVLPSKRVYIYRSWTQHSSSSPSLSTAY